MIRAYLSNSLLCSLLFCCLASFRCNKFMFVVRALFSPLFDDGCVVRFVTFLVPATRSFKPVFLNTPANCHSRVNAVRSAVFKRRFNQGANRQAERGNQSDRCQSGLLPSPLQRGRARVSAEITVGAFDFPLRGDASTGPRSGERGNAANAELGVEGLTGFNGAALG